MRRPDYAIVETQELSVIANGREFVVAETSPPGNFPQFNRLEPTPNNEPMTLRASGEPIEDVVPISEHAACSCGVCGNFLERSVLEHSGSWMYTFFSCNDHPVSQVVIDVFPKVDGYDMSYDWTNSFLGLSTPQVRQGFNVEPSHSDYDKARRLIEMARDNRYVFTPEGIEPVGGSRYGVFGWLAQYVGR